MTAVAEQNPIEVLRLALDSETLVPIADARKALAELEAVVTVLRDVLPRLQYNHEELVAEANLAHKIGSDADCLGCIAYNLGRAALAPFGEEGS